MWFIARLHFGGGFFVDGKKILIRLPNTDVYRLGNEVVTVKQQWDGQYKRWLVTAYDKGNPSNFKNNVPFSYGRSTDVDQFSPRDDSPSGLNGIIDERLSDNSDNVKELNNIHLEAVN